MKTLILTISFVALREIHYLRT